MAGSLLSEAALTGALRRHGVPLDGEQFLAVLDDALASTSTLSAGELGFLARAGVDDEVLEPERVGTARRELALLSEQSDLQAAEGLLTREVAELLRTQPANVRRLLATGGLYASGRRARGEHIFPAWQFTDHRVLPHLAQLLEALPAGLHPLEVQGFMTTPAEALSGRTPAEWLSTDGPPEPVLRLALEESRS